MIIKVGGAVLEDENSLQEVLSAFAKISDKKMLVHGGGRKATDLANKLGVAADMIEGRRITNGEMLEVAVMVYAGLMNKTVVSLLQANNCNALGMTGADGNIVKATKRPVKNGIDYGFAGDVTEVNHQFIQQLLEMGLSPVVNAITHDQKGQLLNTNADTIAQEIAVAMSKSYKVELLYLFEIPGVLEDVKDESSLIDRINKETYGLLKTEGKISGGMVPKLDNAFATLTGGVETVRIGSFRSLSSIAEGIKHTHTEITN